MIAVSRNPQRKGSGFLKNSLTSCMNYLKNRVAGYGGQGLHSKSNNNESQALDRMAILPASTSDQQVESPTSKMHQSQN